MTEQPYKPVSCDYYDELELAAMHKTEVEMEFDLDGVQQKERGIVGDIYSQDGQEFVRFQTGKGPVEVRLDHIIAFRKV